MSQSNTLPLNSKLIDDNFVKSKEWMRTGKWDD